MLANHSWWNGGTTCLALVAGALLLSPARVAAADPPDRAELERQLISVLESEAPPQDKAIPCKQLAIYGSAAAVPALARLLPNEELSSWARIALEVIPDPAAGEALRVALGRLQGRLLIGVINSLSQRRDGEAVEGLTVRLKDSDLGVAQAAAVALGSIGGERAGRVLLQALPTAATDLRSAVAEGCILCAEGFLEAGRHEPAQRLYDTVRQADLPKQRRLEATRGAILARQSGGIPLLLEQLRSGDRAFFGIGLRTARELPGRDVTEALAAELSRTQPNRQGMVLLALADRHDGAVMPAVLAAARSDAKGLRLAALGVLESIGDVSAIPVLLDAAVEADSDVAPRAKGALVRLHGAAVDADLLERLVRAAGKSRQVLIEVATQRYLPKALPAVVQSASDADPGVRGAAIDALGALGGKEQVPDLVKLLPQATQARERGQIERALLAASSRAGAGAVPDLLPLMRAQDQGVRAVGLHALAGVGGTVALGAVRAALEDPVEDVRDEAVRTLSTWPNNWPEDGAVTEPLLALARSGAKPAHRVLGLRGYLQYLEGSKQLAADAKLARLQEVLPLLQRPEEKRLAISVLGRLPALGAVELLTTFANDSAVAEEAASALVGLASKDVAGATKAQRREALQVVLDKAQNEGTKQKAAAALKQIE